MAEAATDAAAASPEPAAAAVAAVPSVAAEKRKAIELVDDPALRASRASASAKPPAKDVFRSRQSKMQRAQAEYQ